MLAQGGDEGVADLVVGDNALFDVRQHRALFLRAGNDRLKRDEQILLVDGLTAHAHGAQGGLVD